ncbi:MAG: hypothetical protein Q8N09_04850 [Thermodesulfovibrionia bacterium]|nr:hypothetical protein [Thermodesulfovibrionia bacterium]
MTDRVYNGFKQVCPNNRGIIEKWWKMRKINIAGYGGIIYEGSVYFTFAEKL